MDFEWSAMLEAMPALLKGAWSTVLIAVVSLSLGMVLGTIVGVVRAYAPRHFAFVAQIYVGLIRGTPMVVQIMFVYFALPPLLGLRLTALTAGGIALTVNSSAYFSEIVRGGFLAVPRGLKEAGQAMGLPLHRIIVHIIGPVAFRRMLPAPGHQATIRLKDTSLPIGIGVVVATRPCPETISANHRAFESWRGDGL